MSEVTKYKAIGIMAQRSRVGGADYVSLADYDSTIARLELLAAYDEAKERELFDRFLSDGNSCGCNHSMWTAWKACAKSRAVIKP